MALIGLVMASLLAGAAAYLVLGGSSDEHERSLHRLQAVVLAHVGGLVVRLSSAAPVRRLADMPVVARACDELDARLLRVRHVREALSVEGTSDVLALALVCWAGLALAATLALGSAVAGLAAWALLIAGLPLRDAAAARKRSEELTAQMPGVLRTLSMALGSGETLAQAIAYVGAHEKGPAGEAFLRASLRLRCGIPAAEALEGLAQELDAPGVGLLVTALVISQRTGSPLKALLESSAALVERQGEFERLLMVKTAQVRLSVRVVCLLPAIMVALLSLISPDFQKGLASAPGMASLACAAVMDGAALLIIRHLMRGVL